MRWNSTEVSDLSRQVPDWEGKMSFKTVSSLAASHSSSSDVGGGFKERYFKLKGNLLFYSREGHLPSGLIVLENVVSVHREESSMFVIIFSDDKKMIFWVSSGRCADNWVAVLSKASYEYQRHLLTDLRLRISQRTGKDPLMGTMFEKRPINYSLQPSPPPRSKSKKASLPSSPFSKPKASFKSHIDGSSEQDLIQF